MKQGSTRLRRYFFYTLSRAIKYNSLIACHVSRVIIKLRISCVYRNGFTLRENREGKIVAFFFPSPRARLFPSRLRTESFIHLGTDWHTPTNDRKVAWEIKTTCQPVSLASVDFTMSSRASPLRSLYGVSRT